MARHRFGITTAVATALALLGAGCSINPATGQRQLALIGGAAGDRAWARRRPKGAIAQYGRYDDDELQAYVSVARTRARRDLRAARPAVELHGGRRPGGQRLRAARRPDLRHPRHPRPLQLRGRAGVGAGPRDRPRHGAPLGRADEHGAAGQPRPRRRDDSERGLPAVRRPGLPGHAADVPQVQPRRREPVRRARPALHDPRRLRPARDAQDVRHPRPDQRHPGWRPDPGLGVHPPQPGQPRAEPPSSGSRQLPPDASVPAPSTATATCAASTASCSATTPVRATSSATAFYHPELAFRLDFPGRLAAP